MECAGQARSGPKAAAAALGAIWAIGISTASAASGHEIFGRWVVESGKAVIELLPCGQQACGRIVWLENPYDETGAPKRDAMNPDPGLRDRFQCGLVIVEGLDRGRDGVWTQGRIYSTRNGGTYGIDVKTIDENSLSVRGYVGLRILGDTRIWRRDASKRSCRKNPGGDETRP